MLRPGWSYSLREAFGLNSLLLPYGYVTDGGHWEKLGLVELFRRGCTKIVCFDASADGGKPLRALGQAMALARDELDVEFDGDTTDDIRAGSADAEDPRKSRAICATLGFRYPNGTLGIVVVAKNVLAVGAPRDVLAYAAVDPSFPSDTTLNQLFDDEHFDAYRELGCYAGLRAAPLVPRRPPPSPTHLRAMGTSSAGTYTVYERNTSGEPCPLLAARRRP